MSKESVETQQYVAIEVPHGTEEKQSGTSYLRMGNLPGAGESPSNIEPGDVDVMNPPPMLEQAPSWEAMEPSFITDKSDMRTGAGQVPTGDQADGKEAWLKELGWRDHCHGNRVTTTYGDKIEVVTGNYKLVVLGGLTPEDQKNKAADDPRGTTGFDMSGGHTVNWSASPGGIKRILQVGDTWRVVFCTEKGDEVNVYQGKLYEHQVGGGKDHYVCNYFGKNHPEIPLKDDKGNVFKNELPLEFMRNTAFAWLHVDERLGQDIFDVAAGYIQKGREGEEFSEDDMRTTPPTDLTAATIDTHYAKADSLREIKVATNLYEVVRADNILVDYDVGHVKEQWKGSYEEVFTGPSRTFDTTTDDEEVDKHTSYGTIKSTFLCVDKYEVSASVNYLEDHISVSRNILSACFVENNVRWGNLNDILWGPVVQEIKAGMIVMETKLAPITLSTVAGIFVDVAAIRIDEEDIALKLVELFCVA